MWLLVSLGKDAGDAAFRDKHIVVTLLGPSPKETRISSAGNTQAQHAGEMEVWSVVMGQV